MLQNSDTEFDNQTEVITTNSNINFSNYNTLAGQLALNQPEKSLTSSTATTSTPVLPTTAAEYVIQYINDSDVATQNTNFEIQIPTQIQQNTDVNQIENYLKFILDNQINMTQTINVLMDNQKKMLHKSASLSVQIDYEFSKCDHTKNTDVVTLGKSNEIENDTFVIKRIDSVKELEELESLLTDKQQKNKLLKQYSFENKQDTPKNSNQTNQTTNQVESVMIVADGDATNETKNTTEDVTEEREEDEEKEESLC
ncbi:unnamed protein product [Arctia plantaginis]|uniref:Uncharacterized protein n=1 Tax=Arctia plantaginis TaxID=874455 RepID=A0A8S1ATF8_ARCPL|nr:unnamed protein product [Arctia plantaginis]